MNLDRYFGNFDDKDEVIKQFEIKPEDLEGYEVLFANYLQECYSGDSYVLLKRIEDGKLFQVQGSHCSCFGLEGQWYLEETTKEALLLRANEGFDWIDAFSSEKETIKKILEGEK